MEKDYINYNSTATLEGLEARDAEELDCAEDRYYEAHYAPDLDEDELYEKAMDRWAKQEYDPVEEQLQLAEAEALGL